MVWIRSSFFGCVFKNESLYPCLESGHDKVGRAVASHHISILVTIGEKAKHIAQGALDGGFCQAHIFSFATNEEFMKEFSHIVQKGDTILLKASRAMAFENILSYIER